MALSETQTAMLALISERIVRDGLPPSQTELAEAFGFRSVRAAQYHLEALEKAGAIRRGAGRARAIQLVAPVQPPADSSAEVISLPVLGRVAAGLPIGADIGSDQSVVVDPFLFSPSPDYLLRVEGDSMRDEGILHGDLVGVHRTPDARNGQIVVARLDDEITIKVLAISDTGIELLSCNADYAPITVAEDADFAVEGIYCGLIRPSKSSRR